MKVSALWITKNEEKNIARTIESVRDVADELVVVDTGSTDGTVAIAEGLGARVLHFEWVDDFAAARNFALQQVDGDIIIFPDADEWFEPKLDAAARNRLEIAFAVAEQQKKVAIVTVDRTNIDLDTEQEINQDIAPRVMHGKGKIYFQGVIHERPVAKESSAVCFLRVDGLRLLHDGYASEKGLEKARRNLGLLNDAFIKTERLWEKALYAAYIVRENHTLDNFEDGIGALNWLAHNRSALHGLIKSSPVGQVLVYSGISTAAYYPARVDIMAVHHLLVDDMERLNKGLPATCLAGLYFDALVYGNTKRLLSELDGQVAQAEAYKSDGTIEVDWGNYRLMAALLYRLAARAAYLRQDKKKALTFAVAALRQKPNVAGIANVLLGCLRGLPAQEVIVFLNSVLDTEARGVLEELVAALLSSSYKQAYLYYMKKLIDKGFAKRGEFWYLQVMLGQCEEAIQGALAAGSEADTEAVSRDLFLAVVCGGRCEWMPAPERLGRYAPVVACFFDGQPITRKEDVALVADNYTHVAVAAGLEVANRLLALVQGHDAWVFMIKQAHYMKEGLSAQFLEENSYTPGMNAADAWLALCEHMLLAGQYAEAARLLDDTKAILAGKGDFYSHCEVVMEKGTKPEAGLAAKLYGGYHDAFLRWCTLLYPATHGAEETEPDTKKQRSALANMTVGQLEKMIAPSGLAPFADMLYVYNKAGGAFYGCGSYSGALECWATACRFGPEDTAGYAGLQKVFTAVGNKTLAALCEKKKGQIVKAREARFNALMTECGQKGEERIFEDLKQGYEALPETVQLSMKRYADTYGLWGHINSAKGDYSLLKGRAAMLAGHWEDFLWLYGRLEDDTSRDILLGYIEDIYSFSPARIFGHSKDGSAVAVEYYDPDILRCGPGEVFVDLGAYTGDSIMGYLRVYGKDAYRRIYAYEISPETFEMLQQNLKGYENITCRPVGAGDKAGIMYLDTNQQSTSANTLQEKGGTEVQTVALDEDIGEPVTFIKMDIEGAEQAALRGAAKHIATGRPKLAVSVYHNYEDIWKIPQMIDEMCPGYHFYFSYNGGNYMPSELSLLAVHPEGADTTKG